MFSPLFSRVGTSVSPVYTFGAFMIRRENGWSDWKFEEEPRFDSEFFTGSLLVVLGIVVALFKVIMRQQESY